MHDQNARRGTPAQAHRARVAVAMERYAHRVRERRGDPQEILRIDRAPGRVLVVEACRTPNGHHFALITATDPETTDRAIALRPGEIRRVVTALLGALHRIEGGQ